MANTLGRGYSRHDAVLDSERKVSTIALFSLGVLCLLLSLIARGADYRVETIADGLRWPWSVARLPEGGFLVTEREGRLLHLNAAGERRVLSGTPATLFAGQGGYLDVVLHPDFRSNRQLYLSYAEGSDNANHTAVFRARLENGELVDGTRILRIATDKTTPQHYGGRMLFMPDGSLLLTSGEGFDHREEAQSLASELGKVLRISDEGTTPRFNPFEGKESRRIWTYGHRNPQGLAYDAVSETLFLHEHGPRGGDEVNILLQGHNYGWPAVTHGVDYSGAYVSPFSSAPDMEDPIWVWVPSIAPSGLAVYRGREFPEWNGDLLVGALVDREIRRLTLKGNRVIAETALLGELGERIRDVRVFDGAVYVLTDGEQGRLLRLHPAR